MTYTELVASYGIGAIAILAFIVNIVVELTKKIGILKRVPTSLYTIMVSIVLTIVTYFATIDLANVAFVWYNLVFAAFGGFIVAYVSMYGWTKFRDVWLRFKR